MSQTDALDTAPQIELRVPGPWESPVALNEALHRAETGYETAEDALVHTKTGRRIECGVSPPDDEIADLFAHDGRLRPDEVDAVAAHTVKIHLSGPGGSPEAARAMMRAATALVRAGGLGVMVDNSGNTHGPRDWLALDSDPQPGGLFWAYVAAAGGRGEVWSHGMHCLGFRDAELFGAPTPDAGGFVLHNFLGYLYQSGVPVLDGDTLGDEVAPRFRAVAYPCYRVKPGTPFYNPYGVWRLEPVEDAEE